MIRRRSLWLSHQRQPAREGDKVQSRVIRGGCSATKAMSLKIAEGRTLFRLPGAAVQLGICSTMRREGFRSISKPRS
jgi:hypothetical protein